MELNDKLSKLTTVPVEHLNKLTAYINLIHSNDILDDLLNDKDLIELKINEGTLVIKIECDCVRYKFIPSEEFDKLVVDTIINKKSKLVDSVTNKLKRALINWKKDLL